MVWYHLVAGRVPMFTVQLEKLFHPVWHCQWYQLADIRQLQLMNMLQMRMDEMMLSAQCISLAAFLITA
jgi:hypothetical protein